MSKYIYLLSFLLFAISSCDSGETAASNNSNINSKNPKSEEPAPSQSTNEQKARALAYQSMGGYLIENFTIEGDLISIKYADKLEDSMAKSEDKGISPDDYWNTGSRIDKVFPLLIGKLFISLDFINNISMNIPYERQTKSISISRQDLETYMGKKFEEVKKDPTEFFNKPYVNQKEGRKNFNNQFLKTN